MRMNSWLASLRKSLDALGMTVFATRESWSLTTVALVARAAIKSLRYSAMLLLDAKFRSVSKMNRVLELNNMRPRQFATL
jgi:hypothetical protein